MFTNGAADNQAVYKQLQAEKVAKFNAPVFLENKQKLGSIDEIFGPINEVVRLVGTNRCCPPADS